LKPFGIADINASTASDAIPHSRDYSGKHLLPLGGISLSSRLVVAKRRSRFAGLICGNLDNRSIQDKMIHR